jgi:hypothetical protein
MRHLPILIPLFLLFMLRADAQIMIGYTGGRCHMPELNREIYIYNVMNSPVKPMKELHWFQGPTIGFRSPGSPFFEVMYSRKKASTMSVFDSSGVVMNRRMKVYGNTFNFGFGARTNSGWGFGGSMDLGRFTGYGKRGPEETIKDQEWQRLWVVDKTRILFISVRLYCAATFWVEKTVGIMTVRLYTQPLAFKQEMDGLDKWFFGGDLNYAKGNEEKFGNTGIAVYLNLGGK